MRVQNPGYWFGSALLVALHFYSICTPKSWEMVLQIFEAAGSPRWKHAGLCSLLSHAKSCTGAQEQLSVGWCLPPLPASGFFSCLYYTALCDRKIFLLSFTKVETWEHFVRWREKHLNTGFKSPQASYDLCLLYSAMNYPTCHRSWRLQYSPALASNERRPHIWVWHRKAQKSLGGGRKAEKRARDTCTTGTTCKQGQSFHTSSFGKLSSKGDKHIPIFNSLAEQKICPWPSLIYTGLSVEAAFNPNTVLKIGWMIKMLTLHLIYVSKGWVQFSAFSNCSV